MLPEIKYLPVNWVDGMKISRKHFTETDQAINDQLRDALALSRNAFNYGLLAADAYGLSSLELHLNIDQDQHLQARLTHCRAITAGGCRIELIGNERLSYGISLKDLLSTYKLSPVNQMRFYVVVSVNPFARVPVGLPSAEEVPPRHPYTAPAYALSIVPGGELNSADFASFHMVLAEVVYEEDTLRQLTDYIPPCTSLASHPALLKWLHVFTHLLQGIESDAFSIIAKIRVRQDKKSDLSALVHFLVERLAFALAPPLTTLHVSAAQQPPLVLLEMLMQVARQVKSTLYCLTSQEREELLNYFEQWSEILPATLLHALEAAITLRYDHLRIARHLQQLQGLYELLATVLRQLSQLEYIGKRKEGWQTFINENPVEVPAEKPGSRWSPLG